ncbi:MAG: DUF3562 domain-containing protein [Thermodesulfovibrionales bacterium]
MKKEDPQTKAIHVIAHDMSVPSDKVARLYGLVLNRYMKRAKVKDFLNVIVERRVRILLAKLQTRQRMY